MASRDKKEALRQLKMEAAEEIGRLQFVKENNDHYKGDVSSRINGEQGGPIGGQMVKKMIATMETQL
ncbi:MAG: alpha/beta-type small acid-soluble spore protein [Bacillota bacterium]|nr:alpha/beta-type small acid-soluble spore protein [Bacillota bacterium]